MSVDLFDVTLSQLIDERDDLMRELERKGAEADRLGREIELLTAKGEQLTRFIEMVEKQRVGNAQNGPRPRMDITATVLALLKEMPPHGTTLRDVCDRVERKPSQVKPALERLVRSGQVRLHPDGRYMV